jgi:hypothetical protein
MWVRRWACGAGALARRARPGPCGRGLGEGVGRLSQDGSRRTIFDLWRSLRTFRRAGRRLRRGSGASVPLWCHRPPTTAQLSTSGRDGSAEPHGRDRSHASARRRENRQPFDLLRPIPTKRRTRRIRPPPRRSRRASQNRLAAARRAPPAAPGPHPLPSPKTAGGADRPAAHTPRQNPTVSEHGVFGLDPRRGGLGLNGPRDPASVWRDGASIQIESEHTPLLRASSVLRVVFVLTVAGALAGSHGAAVDRRGMKVAALRPGSERQYPRNRWRERRHRGRRRRRGCGMGWDGGGCDGSVVRIDPGAIRLSQRSQCPSSTTSP